ncbi:MAG: hypothetical protein OQK57_00815 [Ignavibacteriaceae bacterium]|nr:hypothetical protein [Ignavibacteriaceae bacterium]
MLKKHLNKIFFIVLLVLIAAQVIFFYSSRDIEVYSALFLSASAIYLLFVSLLFKADVSKNQLLVILISFFLLKIIFVNTEPVGSDDYYRYIWDGKVLANGINPFLYAPNDQALSELHSELLPEKVSYPNIKTIYFPVSQWLFTVSYWISGENAVGLKIFYLIFELMILLSLYALFNKFLIEKKYLLIYAALPLITFQFFIDAHIDLVGVALMIASISLYFYNKKFLSYVLLGLSVSVKPTGLLLIPFYIQNETFFKEKLKSFYIPITIFMITFLPYILTATPLDTLINYSINWTYNGMIYNSLSLFLANNVTIRIICAMLYLLALGFIYFSKYDLIRKIFLSLFILMIFSPVVHPWYLIWFVVFLPVVRSYSGIYFGSAISLTSFSILRFQLTGEWEEYSWVLLAQYVPILIIFYYEMKRKVFSNKINF